MQWQILERLRIVSLSSTRPEKSLYLNNLSAMATLRKLSLQQQATLFAPDLTKIEEEQKKKIYFYDGSFKKESQAHFVSVGTNLERF